MTFDRTCDTCGVTLVDADDPVVVVARQLPGGGFVSVSRDLRLHIWSDGSTRSFATPHRNSIKCCAVSDDGTLVATGDYAGRVGLFDLERSQYINISRLRNLQIMYAFNVS